MTASRVMDCRIRFLVALLCRGQVPMRPVVSVRSKVEAGGGKETMGWKELRGVHASVGEGRRGGFAQGDQPPSLCCGRNSSLPLIWCSACFSNAMVIDRRGLLRERT